MISPESVQAFLAHFKFLDIFTSFLLATMPFIYCCKRRPRFFLRVAGSLLSMRVVCLVLAYTYDGTLAMEVPYSMIVITLLILCLMFCYNEKLWNVVFYFGSGFMTWYVTDRLFLVIASLCRLSNTLRPYFVEDTVPHMLLYVGCFAVVYLFIFFTVGRKMRRLGGSEIPMQNALLLFALVCILYVFMLMIQVLMLASAKERAEFHTMQKLWLEEQKQYRLTKENIEALNIKCHDLKHQIRSLRETGQVDPAYLDSLERSVSIYNSAIQTGNETLDIVLTDKRLHCATHGIQFTCIAEGSRMAFMEVMDIFSLFGNILDNAIECETKLPPETRFIHLSVRAVNQLLLIHVENHFEGALELRDGIPLTTKDDKDYHGYGMLSIRRIVEKCGGNFEISTEDQLFQIDIMLPIPADAAVGGGRE